MADSVDTLGTAQGRHGNDVIDVSHYAPDLIRALRQLCAKINKGRPASLQFRIETRSEKRAEDSKPNEYHFLRFPGAYAVLAQDALKALAAAQERGELFVTNTIEKPAEIIDDPGNVGSAIEALQKSVASLRQDSRISEEERTKRIETLQAQIVALEAVAIPAQGVTSRKDVRSVDESVLAPLVRTIGEYIDEDIRKIHAARVIRLREAGHDLLDSTLKNALDLVLVAFNEGKSRENKVSYRFENSSLTFLGPDEYAQKARTFYDSLRTTHESGQSLDRKFVSDFIFREITANEDARSQFIKLHRNANKRKTVKISGELSSEQRAILKFAGDFFEGKKGTDRHRLKVGFFDDQIIIFSNNNDLLSITQKAFRTLLARLQADSPQNIASRQGYKPHQLQEIWREATGDHNKEIAEVKRQAEPPAPNEKKPEFNINYPLEDIITHLDGDGADVDLIPFIELLARDSKSQIALKGFQNALKVRISLTRDTNDHNVLAIEYPEFISKEDDSAHHAQAAELTANTRLAFKRALKNLALSWVASKGQPRLKFPYVESIANLQARLLVSKNGDIQPTIEKVVLNPVGPALRISTLPDIEISDWLHTILAHRNTPISFSAFDEFEELSIKVRPVIDPQTNKGYFEIAPAFNASAVDSRSISAAERILKRVRTEWDLENPMSKRDIRIIIEEELRKIERERVSQNVLPEEDLGGSIKARNFRTSGTHPKSEIHIPGRSEPIVPQGMTRDGIEEQRSFICALNDDNIQYLLTLGPAGVGKTYLAIAAAVEAFERGDVRKIILSKPNVEMGEKLGFLPGSADQKMDPHVESMLQYLRKFYASDKIKALMDQKKIEIVPIAFMRGRNFDDAFVVIDEGQNVTDDVLESILTRKARSSKMVIVGDGKQSDRAIDQGRLLRERLDDMIQNAVRIKRLKEFERIATDDQRKIYDFERQIAFLERQIIRTRAITSKITAIIETNGQFEAPIEMVARALNGMPGFQFIRLSSESTVRDPRIPMITDRLDRARRGYDAAPE